MQQKVQDATATAQQAISTAALGVGKGERETGISAIAGEAAVSSTDPQKYPLQDKVRFFLHPTFTVEKPFIKVNNKGIAELNLTSWGAFTVGVIADEGATRLELDLAELEDAPVQFRLN